MDAQERSFMDEDETKIICRPWSPQDIVTWIYLYIDIIVSNRV